MKFDWRIAIAALQGNQLGERTVIGKAFALEGHQDDSLLIDMSAQLMKAPLMVDQGEVGHGLTSRRRRRCRPDQAGPKYQMLDHPRQSRAPHKTELKTGDYSLSNMSS